MTLRLLRLAAPACAALALASCDLIFGPGDIEPLERLPRELSESEQQIIAGSNAFAFDILRETIARDNSDNVMLSPLSASMALGMALNGASAATYEQMRDALGFAGLEQADINASYSALLDLLLGLDDAIEMRIGNSVWARSSTPFHATFMDAVRESFDAEVASLDFDDPAAVATINDWVSRSTNDRIRDIVAAPIPADAVMYLINAIYFKGSWTEQFERGRTAPAPFRARDGGTIDVQMMMRRAETHYTADQDVEVAELRYGRGAYVMDIVLPREGRAVDDVIASLDDARWRAWIDGLHENEMVLRMPKYRFDYETTMNDALVALGMSDAFDDHAADFSALSPLGDDMFISSVKQKTFINVDEEGTEAAAATSVEVGIVSAPPMMVVDRPFIVAIRERFSGTIVFLGRIAAPEL